MEDREYKGKILVVDDEETIRDVLTKFFEGKEYDIQTAESGREAIEKLGSYDPDILLLDLKMPDMDGEEVLRHIQEKGLKAGVIVITGNPGYVEDKSLLASAYDYIVKPFDLDYLNTTVLSKVMLLADSE